MPETRDGRRSPRIRVRIPNSLRIRVKDGDCLADLLDISERGVGVEFFDLFDAIVFTEGDVVKLQFVLKPEQVNDKGASTIIETIRKQNQDKSENIGDEPATGVPNQENFETDAKIVWTYLNRLGLEFVV
ncbi:MAG: PilZ domain-containing protein [Desulfomonilaceae bacterium]